MPAPSAPTTTPAAAPPGGPPAGLRHAYQTVPACSDRSRRCGNRNGVWPPLYKRNWRPHPPRSLPSTAQGEWQRSVLDAVAAGQLHRTTGAVLLAFSRASDGRLADVWIGQRTVGERLGLAESTVCHHVTVAKRAGWVEVQHRNRLDRGAVLAMTNVTRFVLPQVWRDRLDEERRQRDARRARQRTQRPGRTTERRRGGEAGGDDRRPVATPERDAAAVGAALARSAEVGDFEAGRRELEEAFRGRPGLYEAAYDAFAETWKTVRMQR